MADTLPILIFDFDGTLIESAPELQHCLNAILAEHGRPALPVEAVKKMIGNGVKKLVERGFEATGGAPADFEATVERFMEHYHAAPVEDTLYDGVRPTLDLLRKAGHRMAICTNKPYQATTRILNGLEIAEFFEAVAGGDSFSVRKPDPGHLLGVLEILGTTPSRAIMIGDSPNDIGCALAAKVRSVAVTYGYSNVPHAELGADVLIDRFDALPGALTELSA
jgi:phosphoglycolate phosphatase